MPSSATLAGRRHTLGSHSCGLVETASIADWRANQSAGQCRPCVHGLPAIAHAVDDLVAGDRQGRAQRHLRRWLAMVAGRGACRHPDGVVKLVESALVVFEGSVALRRPEAVERSAAAKRSPIRWEKWEGLRAFVYSPSADHVTADVRFAPNATVPFAVIEYNPPPTYPEGDGGAGIFFHLDTTVGYTEGCVANPLADLNWALAWMSPDAHPHIVIGVPNEMDGF